MLGAVWIGSLRRSLNESVQARNVLVRQIAEAKLAPADAGEIPAGNLPIAVLQANRAAGGESVLAVPPGSREVALWMDVEAGGRYRSFAVALLINGGGTGGGNGGWADAK